MRIKIPCKTCGYPAVIVITSDSNSLIKTLDLKIRCFSCRKAHKTRFKT